eukprot:3941416-Rhodomonas_salina.1
MSGTELAHGNALAYGNRNVRYCAIVCAYGTGTQCPVLIWRTGLQRRGRACFSTLGAVSKRAYGGTRTQAGSSQSRRAALPFARTSPLSP